MFVLQLTMREYNKIILFQNFDGKPNLYRRGADKDFENLSKAYNNHTSTVSLLQIRDATCAQLKDQVLAFEILHQAIILICKTSSLNTLVPKSFDYQFIATLD